MFTYKPEIKKKNALYFTFTMFTVTAICLMTGYAGLSYSGLFQIVGLGALTAGIFVTSRYLLSTFRYYADYENGILSLGVEKTQGKKIITAACVALATVISVDKFTSDHLCEKKFESEYGKIKHKFNFCQNLFPRDKICVMLNFNNNPTVLYLEGDNSLIESIRALIGSAEAEISADE